MLKDLNVTIAALLVAHACNVGYTPVIGSADALKYGRLSHVDQTYLRLAAYRAANAALIDYQASIPLAQAWGGGLVASVDGMRFVVPVPSVYAWPNPKYFGRRGGATWLNMINDQAAGLGRKDLGGLLLWTAGITAAPQRFPALRALRGPRPARQRRPVATGPGHARHTLLFSHTSSASYRSR